MRTIAFHQSAFDQYNEWALRDKKTFERLRRLIIETARTPSPESANPNRLNVNSQVIGRAESRTNTGSSIRSLTTN
jgi:Txe/YoeB family toxin of Txe-Axe toxin-antitoxin module